MFTINKLQANHIVDFAAEELKKYLCMLDMTCDAINIVYAPDAKDGFRLGLLDDFGIDFEGKNAKIEADGNAKVSGKQVTVEASSALKLSSGGMVAVEGKPIKLG